MNSIRLTRLVGSMVIVLFCTTTSFAQSPTVSVDYQARVEDAGDLQYAFVDGAMTGTVRGNATYTVPVQIHYPVAGGHGTAVLELTNSALLFFNLAARGDRPGDRRSDTDDVDELESMLVNFG